MRRPSTFTAAAILLVAGTLLGMLIGDQRGSDLGFGGDVVPLFGTTGLYSVAVGLAAFAATGLRAVVRAVSLAVAAFVVFGIVLAVLVLVDAPIDVVLPEWVPGYDGIGFEGDYDSSNVTSRIGSALLVVFAAGAIGAAFAIPVGIAGWLARYASLSTTGGPVHVACVAIATAPAAIRTVLSATDGLWPAAVAGVLAIVWLRWALSLARAAHAATPVAEPTPV